MSEVFVLKCFRTLKWLPKNQRSNRKIKKSVHMRILCTKTVRKHEENGFFGGSCTTLAVSRKNSVSFSLQKQGSCEHFLAVSFMRTLHPAHLQDAHLLMYCTTKDSASGSFSRPDLSMLTDNGPTKSGATFPFSANHIQNNLSDK